MRVGSSYFFFLSDNCAMMSDMGSTRISVRMSEELTSRLRRHCKTSGASESELVREALETYLRRPGKNATAYELAERSGLIGSIDAAPRDLSTNRRYLKGFGKNK